MQLPGRDRCGSGVTVTLALSQPEVEKVIAVRQNGSRLHARQNYCHHTVAVFHQESGQCLLNNTTC